MPWELENVALNPTHAMKRRVAPRMEMEPTIAGVRIRLRQKLTISDESYATNKVRIDLCVKQGVLTAKRSGSQAPKQESTAPVAPTPEAPVEAPEEPETTPEPPPLPEPVPEFQPSEDVTQVERPKGKKSKRGKR